MCLFFSKIQKKKSKPIPYPACNLKKQNPFFFMNVLDGYESDLDQARLMRYKKIIAERKCPVDMRNFCSK